ncbi:MAG: cob(I)yrinic acid a,c-diamide adenosyltransferase [Planctomycetota bacterium]|nr:cob(I)yrinic acid a,c-diamide adenosyltransferase [Planctomycetota bacterium]MDA1177937.1 cob(I)yrinic acid a,c-diamide adenosyltransferase [Planctomycetota bacterium]
MKIYTRTGDDGDTGVLGGRVSKSDERIAAYGTVDELNAHLGLVVAEAQRVTGDHAPHPLSARMTKLVEFIQGELFCVGAELAALDPDRAGTRMLENESVSGLERFIDEWESSLPPLQQFILPGGVPLAAQLHIARTVCRRAERQVVRLRLTVPDVSARLVIYLNRLGDLLFVLARRANHDVRQPETPWRWNGGLAAEAKPATTDDSPS